MHKALIDIAGQFEMYLVWIVTFYVGLYKDVSIIFDHVKYTLFTRICPLSSPSVLRSGLLSAYAQTRLPDSDLMVL